MLKPRNTSTFSSHHRRLLVTETPGTINRWDDCRSYHILPLVAMPGSGKQNADVQKQIIEFLEAGIDPTTIHRRLKVGRSSIYRMKRCLQQHGTAYAPPETNKKNGRPKVMTAEQEQVGLRLCDALLSGCKQSTISLTRTFRKYEHGYRTPKTANASWTIWSGSYTTDSEWSAAQQHAPRSSASGSKSLKLRNVASTLTQLLHRSKFDRKRCA